MSSKETRLQLRVLATCNDVGASHSNILERKNRLGRGKNLWSISSYGETVLRIPAGAIRVAQGD
jgi:hypothetical protein